MLEPLETFKTDILAHCPALSKEAWDLLADQVLAVSYKKGDTIFPDTEVCTQILYIAQGIAASENQTKEEWVISRFFRVHDLCTNVVSLVSGRPEDDRLFAITQVHGVLIPKALFMNLYLADQGVGLYFRKKLLDVILTDKRYISAKSMSKVQSQLAFLQEHYPEVLLETPWKYIASFMGVTPEWLSRILKKGS